MNDDIQENAAGLAITEKSEGCKLVAYQDSVGVWTIGYGHTHGVTEGMTCSEAQAAQWLMQDLADAQSAVRTMVTVPLNANQFSALVDFVFNEGSGHFESSTLLRLLNAGDYTGSDAQFAAWDKAGGKVLAGLLTRRNAEAALFVEAA